jgi:hypothetical protein
MTATDNRWNHNVHSHRVVHDAGRRPDTRRALAPS